MSTITIYPVAGRYPHAVAIDGIQQDAYANVVDILHDYAGLGDVEFLDYDPGFPEYDPRDEPTYWEALDEHEYELADIRRKDGR